MIGREARGQKLGVTRGNDFSLASYISPGFFAISRRTVTNNAGQDNRYHYSLSSFPYAVQSKIRETCNVRREGLNGRDGTPRTAKRRAKVFPRRVMSNCKP